MGAGAMHETSRVTFATGGGFDRAAHLRDVAVDLLAHRRALLLPVWRGKVLIDLSGENPALGWVAPTAGLLGDASDTPVFLGQTEEVPCFAADFSRLPDEDARNRFAEGSKFIDLRSIGGALPRDAAAMAATAKGVIGWHLTHPYCARCATASVAVNGGWRRECPGCGAQHFPRTDPVVIMLIVNGDDVLLGRQSVWPPGLHSLIAGFMEPGETIEHAVRRETLEETGIRVGPVGYAACQPWPFPSSLMIGCWGLAESTAIDIDPDELEAARWVGRATMRTILDGGHPQIAPPRPDAIARAMLTDWANGDLKV